MGGGGDGMRGAGDVETVTIMKKTSEEYFGK